MDFQLSPGLKLEKHSVVTEELTAAQVGSGGLAVYATPSMAALMESAAFEVCETVLPDGFTTVGTKLDIRHLSATPVGMNVHAIAELENCEGQKLTFSLAAFDEMGKIGDGTHERYIVEAVPFLRKANTKLTRI